MIPLKEIVKSSQNVNTFFEDNGWKWPKDKRFLQVVEEIGEFSDEILNGNQESQIDELWDICFTYLGYMEELEKEDFSHRKEIIDYVKDRTKNINLEDRKEIILWLNGSFSLENKAFRKAEGRKDDYEIRKLDEKKQKYLNLYLLNELTKTYGVSVNSVVNNSIDKFNKRING